MEMIRAMVDRVVLSPCPSLRDAHISHLRKIVQLGIEESPSPLAGEGLG
ncbi:Recombinase [Azospirillum largimobile]